MSSKRIKISARTAALLCTSFLAASLAVGCGDDNNPGGGSAGDAGAADEAGASGKGKAGAGGKAGSGGKTESGGKAGSAAGGAEDEGGNGGTAAGGSGTGASGNAGKGGTAGFGGAGLGGNGAMSGNAGKGGSGGVGGSAGLGGNGGVSGNAGNGGTAGSTAGTGVAGNFTAGSGGTAGSAIGGSGGSAGSAIGGSGGSAGSAVAGSGGSSSAVCGNHIKEGAEQCDDGSAGSTSSASSKCSNSCTNISTQACVDCENAGDCFESVDNCLGVAAPFSNAEQTQCFSVIACIQSSNCFDGTGTLGKCYCGDLSTSACSAAPFTGAGSPNGACVNQIKAGFPTFTSNAAILGGLVATDYPSGAAMKRLSCQKGANSSACLGTCGFTAGGPAFP